MTLYWDWIRSEAALINSDGCSKVSGFMVECCWEHDLAFYYAKDPQDAYLRILDNGLSRLDAWHDAAPITFTQANTRFKRCHIQRTKWGHLGWLNPLTWIRWRGVVRLSKGAWDAHRAREQEMLR